MTDDRRLALLERIAKRAIGLIRIDCCCCGCCCSEETHREVAAQRTGLVVAWEIATDKKWPEA